MAWLWSCAGLDELVRGERLWLLDEDGRAALRGRLAGFVFQSFQLLPAMTALENVMLPLELSGEARRLQQSTGCGRMKR